MTEDQAVNIYILPSEPNLPPRAVLFEETEDEVELPDGGKATVAKGVQVTWSYDMGTWGSAGVPLPSDMADAITAHARSLGVDL